MKINSTTIPLLTHDLKGPVGNVAMFSQLISSGLEQLQSELGVTHDLTALRWQVDYINGMAQKYVDQLQNWADYVFMLEGKADFDTEKVHLNHLVEEIIASNELFWKKKNIPIQFNSSETFLVYAETDVIRRVIDNLFQLVILLVPPKTICTIQLNLCNPEQVELRISGLKSQDAYLFEKLFVEDLQPEKEPEFTKGIIKTTGIGLAFCGLAIKTFGGLPVCRATDSGLLIGFSLPVASK